MIDSSEKAAAGVVKKFEIIQGGLDTPEHVRRVLMEDPHKIHPSRQQDKPAKPRLTVVGSLQDDSDLGKIQGNNF